MWAPGHGGGQLMTCELDPFRCVGAHSDPGFSFRLSETTGRSRRFQSDDSAFPCSPSPSAHLSETFHGHQKLSPLLSCVAE